MAFQSAPDIAEVVIHATYDGKEVVNVLHAMRAGYTLVDVGNLAAAVDGAVGTFYLPLLNNGVTYNFTSAKGLALINDVSATDNTSAGPGTGGAITLPANVTLCITFRTGLTGRSARGRVYALPIPETSLASVNGVSSAFATNMQTCFDTIKSAMAAAGWIQVVLSRRTGLALRPTGVGFPITAVEARNLTLDSQRGRLPKGH